MLQKKIPHKNNAGRKGTKSKEAAAGRCKGAAGLGAWSAVTMAAVYARAHSAAEARQEALKLRDRALQRQVRALRRALGSAAHSRRDLGAAADAALSRGLTFHTCAPPGGSVAAVTGSASRVGRQHRLRSGGGAVGVFVRRRYFATFPFCTPGTTCRTLLTGSGFVFPLPPSALLTHSLFLVGLFDVRPRANAACKGKRRAYKRTGKQIPYPPNQPSPVLDPAEIPRLTGTGRARLHTATLRAPTRPDSVRCEAGNNPPAQDDDNPLDIQSRDGWINFFSSPMRPDAFKSNTKEIPLAADRSLPPLEVYTPHGANGHGVGVRVQGDSTRPAVLEISGGETANSWMYDLPSLPARPSYLGHLLSPSDPSTTTNPLSTHTTTQHHSHPPKGTEGRVDEDGAGGRGRVGEPPSSGNNSVTSMAAAQRGASSPRSLPPAQRSDKQAREMRTRVVAPPLELGVDGPWERDDVVRSESESGSGAAEHADDEHDHKRSSSESKSREHAKTWRSSKSVKSVKKAVSGIWHGGGNSDSSKDPSRKGLSRKRVRAKTSHNLPVHKLNEMGQIVDKKGHQAWDMACGLQNGIRVMVSMNSHKTHGIEPDFECFQEKIKLKFPTAGSSLTPPHDGPAFTFKDYTPQVFRELRSIFGIDTADYMVALCNTQPDGSNALRIMGTPGKSGSLFFFSNDMKVSLSFSPLHLTTPAPPDAPPSQRCVCLCGCPSRSLLL